jgi:hypothetical protein
MNTIIIEHADKSTTALFKQLAEKLGLSFKTKTEKQEPGVITNPELLKTIEDYESGKVKPFPVDEEMIKKSFPDA